MAKELIRGVVPESLSNVAVYKNVKKGQSSFRITKKLLDDIYSKAQKLNKGAHIQITIPSESGYNYIVTAMVRKEKGEN